MLKESEEHLIKKAKLVVEGYDGGNISQNMIDELSSAIDHIKNSNKSIRNEINKERALYLFDNLPHQPLPKDAKAGQVSLLVLKIQPNTTSVEIEKRIADNFKSKDEIIEEITELLNEVETYKLYPIDKLNIMSEISAGNIVASKNRLGAGRPHKKVNIVMYKGSEIDGPMVICSRDDEKYSLIKQVNWKDYIRIGEY